MRMIADPVSNHWRCHPNAARQSTSTARHGKASAARPWVKCSTRRETTNAKMKSGPTACRTRSFPMNADIKGSLIRFRRLDGFDRIVAARHRPRNSLSSPRCPFVWSSSEPQARRRPQRLWGSELLVQRSPASPAHKPGNLLEVETSRNGDGCRQSKLVAEFFVVFICLLPRQFLRSGKTASAQSFVSKNRERPVIQRPWKRRGIDLASRRWRLGVSESGALSMQDRT